MGLPAAWVGTARESHERVGIGHGGHPDGRRTGRRGRDRRTASPPPASGPAARAADRRRPGPDARRGSCVDRGARAERDRRARAPGTPRAGGRDPVGGGGAGNRRRAVGRCPEERSRVGNEQAERVRRHAVGSGALVGRRRMAGAGGTRAGSSGPAGRRGTRVGRHVQRRRCRCGDRAALGRRGGRGAGRGSDDHRDRPAGHRGRRSTPGRAGNRLRVHIGRRGAGPAGRAGDQAAGRRAVRPGRGPRCGPAGATRDRPRPARPARPPRPGRRARSGAHVIRSGHSAGVRTGRTSAADPVPGHPAGRVPVARSRGQPARRPGSGHHHRLRRRAGLRLPARSASRHLPDRVGRAGPPTGRSHGRDPGQCGAGHAAHAAFRGADRRRARPARPGRRGPGHPGAGRSGRRQHPQRHRGCVPAGRPGHRRVRHVRGRARVHPAGGADRPRRRVRTAPGHRSKGHRSEGHRSEGHRAEGRRTRAGRRDHPGTGVGPPRMAGWH